MALFGAPEGDQAAIQSMQGLAQTQGVQLDNQGKQQALQQQAGMGQIMQGLAQNKPDEDAVSRMEDAATLGMKSGYTATATKLATDAAGIRLKQAEATHATAQTANQQYVSAKAELDMVDKLLGNVTDQASWDASNSLFESMTGRPSPLKGVPYSPSLVKSLQDQTLSMKDKIDLGIKQFNAETRAKSADSAASFRDFRKGILAQDLQVKKDREDRLKKVTGSKADVGAPVKGEIDHAADLVTSEFPNLPDDEANSAAYQVASRARALRKTTPGLDADSAMQRAIAEAKTNGQLKTLDDNYRIMGIPIPGSSTKRSTFDRTGGKPAGSTPDLAIGNIPPSPADRKVGAYYKHGGNTYRWQKGGWEVVGSGSDDVPAR